MVLVAVTAQSFHTVCIVSTAPKAPQGKQHGARRTKLLPNEEQKQQRNAASPVLLGYARVSKAEDQDTAPQIEALEAEPPRDFRRLFGLSLTRRLA